MDSLELIALCFGLFCVGFLLLSSKGKNTRHKKIDDDLNIQKNHHARWLDKNMK